MKAVVYKQPCEVAVERVDDARIEAPNDAVIEITSAAICGSDLHMYEGRTGAKSGTVFGHENLGMVREVGPGVTNIKIGDRVVLPFNIACGYCFNCLRGFTSACLTVNQEAPHAAYGYADMGPFKGGQAEYLRVPNADFNCLKLPGTPGDQWEDDFVTLADIWPTGHHGVELAGVEVGSTVAVFGAGPVGLMAVLSATIKGASEIYCIDKEPGRLKLAEQAGAIPIDFSKGDPVEQVMAMRKNNKAWLGSRRPGEERLTGVLHGIDAVGYQARDDQDLSRENPMQVFDDLIRLVDPTGKIGMVGVYMPKDPKGVDEKAKQGIFEIPWGQAFNKGLTIGMGQAPVKRYNEYLRDLIIAGKAKPSFIVSHRLPLDAAPDAYKRFDERGSEYTKVILKPGLAA
jgi:glutathione-independent formaldehyde dehydrogenase